MTRVIDDIMEPASVALAAGDYLTCEDRCLEALALARQTGDWTAYARVLLPLQEARRQRRMIACDAGVLTSEDPGHATGCLVLNQSHPRTQVHRIQADAHAAGHALEILWVILPESTSPSTDRWQIRSFNGPEVACTVRPPGSTTPGSTTTPDIAWFLEAGEALGDAAIAQVTAPPGSVERVDQLEQRLAVIPDHEKLHQSLAHAAQAMPPRKQAPRKQSPRKLPPHDRAFPASPPRK